MSDLHAVPDFDTPRTLGGYALNQVYCEDALTFLKGLPDESVNCVVTSPPYNISWHAMGKSSMFRKLEWLTSFEKGYENYPDDMPEAEYQAWVSSVVRECLRVSKGLVWVNHKMRFRDGVGIHPLSFLPFPVWQEIIWNRGGSMSFNGRRFATSHEYIYGFGRPDYWNGDTDILMSVWRIVPINKDDGHPCPYPEQLVERLLVASCPPNGIVLDPFMGSGTTAVVAQKLGRQFIGCDISAEYVALANKRLAMPYTPQMFDFTQEEHA